MAKYINPAKVVTGVCRFSYANLWEAKAMDENSKPKYSVSLIIPKSDTKTIEKIRAAIQAAQPTAPEDIPTSRPSDFATCLVVSNASLFPIVTISSTILVSITSGMNPAPIPCIL